MIEGEKFAGFPRLCHRNPRVYTAMFDYARLVIEDFDFDGSASISSKVSARG
jgi:alpha-amylase